MTPRCETWVVKVGGSLFVRDDLAQRLRAWLAANAGVHHVLLAGGGPLVDAVRDLDARFGLAPHVAHWLAVDAMGVSARLLAALLGETPPVDDFHALASRAAQPGLTVLDAGPLLRTIEPRLPGTRLPCSWDATSDSIAARLAVGLGAARLVLLKSASPPDGDTARPLNLTLNELAAAGYVDHFLPKLAGEIPRLDLIELKTA